MEKTVCADGTHAVSQPGKRLFTVNLGSLLLDNAEHIALGVRVNVRDLGDTSRLGSLVDAVLVAL
jgi:hypothetical protein